MKIGILTHPQAANYGGILQCYALTSFLERQGHETIIIRRVSDRSFFLWVWIRHVLKVLHFPRYYTVSQDVVDRTVNIRPFVEKNFERTPPIDSHFKMKRVCKKYGLDAVIVGSDQVWRKSFAMPFGYNYFLDFVPDSVIKASYAASFGLSEWNYSQQQTKQIGKLLRRFKGLSVREEDGVKLLENNVGLKANQHMDPTLLLTEKDYETVTSPRLEQDKYVFVYWLGVKDMISDSINKYRANGYKVVEVYLRDEKEQISVEDWLSYIKYADLVLTDSFHGCVFCLIFNKQFIVLPNKSGGYGRILSLLHMAGLNEDKTDHIEDDMWRIIDVKLSEYKEISHAYFNNVLK